MGRYIDEILQSDEKVLYSAPTHWKVYWPAIGFWIPAIACLIAWRGATGDGALMLWLGLAAVLGLAALFYTARAWFHRWTTETDVTTGRVVHKTGFIQRSTFEMNIDKVESVDVEQTVLGRIFGYGNVKIQGVGDGERMIQDIARPIEFRNYITAR